MAEVEPAVEVHEWKFPAYNVGLFKAKVSQANKRLLKAGLDARFEMTYTDFERKRNVSAVDHSVVSGHDAVFVTEPWVRAEMAGPLRLSHGHFTFVARLVSEEAGVTVHSAPGQELGGFAPNGTTGCDHCGVDRARTRLYLVRDERDGSIIQLGHSCIELYTGVSPKGLWALTFDEELSEVAASGGGSFGPQHYGASIAAVLAYAFAHSDQGRSYQRSDGYGPSTAGMVRTSLFGNIHQLREADRAYFTAKAAEASTYLADTELLAAITASVNTTAEDSDYGRNLRVILAGESVSGRNVGILASLVKVYARAMQLEAERKATPVVSGFLGVVGERIRNIGGVAKTVVYSDGAYGTTTFLVGITDDGHTLVWSASRGLAVNVGDRFTITAATVKAHEPYRNVDQTVITRAAGFDAAPVTAGVAE